MIYFDTTKSGGAAHRSGLMRVTTRLVAELGAAAKPVRWPDLPAAGTAAEWWVTAELFSEPERPGISTFLASRRVRTAAIFHDAIPLKHPHITWPQSVARHPGYMKLLAEFERVFAVSQASRTELEGFWRWQGVTPRAAVAVLPLGADFDGRSRASRTRVRIAGRPELLCVGIVEPRKNQPFLLDVVEQLWNDGLDFELHVVGRVNPHFGRPIAARLRQLERRQEGRLRWHDAIDDAGLAERYARARATVLPTIAEGCGLPLLESLWQGVPCVCSDLPALRENADGGGCLALPVNDANAWLAGLRRVLNEDAFVHGLRAAAMTRSLPAWATTARVLQQALATLEQLK